MWYSIVFVRWKRLLPSGMWFVMLWLIRVCVSVSRNPGDGGRRFLWNIRTYLPECMVSHLLGQQFSYLLSREPQNLHIKWCVSTYEQNNTCLWSHSLVLSVRDIWCKVFTIKSKYASNLRDFLQVKLCVRKTRNIRNVRSFCVCVQHCPYYIL